MRPLRKAGLLRGINTLDSGNKEIICLFHTQRSPFKGRRGGGGGWARRWQVAGLWDFLSRFAGQKFACLRKICKHEPAQ